MKFFNYSEVRSYLESFIKPVVFERITKEQAKIQDPLLRMRHFLSLLGNPQNKFPSILVGGTAGKGSTAYLISHILKTAGYKVGLTISPHLEKINERIQINDEQIPDQKLIELVSSITQTIELMEKSKFGEPSYFEILVALAFQHFAKERVDIAIVEVGLGGRYDATNTLNPLISVLTNVSLDHTQILGKTVEQIAREKIGIIKGAEVAHDPVRRGVGSPRSVVITGVKQPSVVKIVEDKCREAEVELYRLSKDFSFEIKKESLEETVFDLTTKRDRVKKLNGLGFSLLGQYQVENASLAITAVLQLEKFGFDVDEQHIRQALKTAFFPGRFEVIPIAWGPVAGFPPASARSSLNLPSQGSNELRAVGSLSPRATPRKNYTLDANNYTLVLDGAHNPTKMRAFLGTLKKLYPKESPTSPRLRGVKKIFVIAFKNDKDIKGMLKQILSVADSIIITEFKVTTDVSKNAAMPAATINNQLSTINTKKKINVFIEKDSREALEKALNILISQDPNINTVIVVTGSLYLVGEMRGFVISELDTPRFLQQGRVGKW